MGLMKTRTTYHKPISDDMRVTAKTAKTRASFCAYFARALWKRLANKIKCNCIGASISSAVRGSP